MIHPEGFASPIFVKPYECEMALGELLNCLGDRAAHAHKGTGLKRTSCICSVARFVCLESRKRSLAGVPYLSHQNDCFRREVCCPLAH